MCTNSNTCPQKLLVSCPWLEVGLKKLSNKWMSGKKLCVVWGKDEEPTERNRKSGITESWLFFCLSFLFYVTGRVDRFGVCVPSRLYNKVLCVLCVLTLMHYTVCYFTDIFYAVVRHISMLSIDNKDSGFWMDSGLCWCSSVASCLRCSLSPILSLTGSYQHLSMGLLAQLNARQ